jgi:hypothetical protein
VHDEQVLRRVGASALEPFREQPEWIHRRVEVITFPAKNDPIVRRRVSIDFTIPQGLAPAGPQPEDQRPAAGGQPPKAAPRPYFYVPLSVLRKWPPVLQLDLRDEEDKAVPLLTRAQNGIADAALLRALALEVGGVEKLPAQLDELLEAIALRPGAAARAAVTELIPPDPAGDDVLRAALRNDPAFLELAGGLVDNTLLWLRIAGRHGDRKIVKFAYDVAREIDLRTFAPAAFGLEPLETRVDTPHIGTSGSYHLAVVSPPPLDITNSEITLSRRATPLHIPAGDVVARCSAVDSREHDGPLEPTTPDDGRPPHDLRLYTDALGRQARFYVAGDREGCFGELKIWIAVQRSGFLRGAAIATTLIAALLLAFALGLALGSAGKRPERLTPVLLLVPALLAYLVVRPDDHAVAREFLSGTRAVLLGTGLAPIVCATSLAVGAGAWWVHAVAWASAIATGVAAVVLWAPLWPPLGDRVARLLARVGAET